MPAPCDPYAPWQFLNFLPLPHGHGSLRPTFGVSRRIVILGNWISAGAAGADASPLGAAAGAAAGAGFTLLEVLVVVAIIAIASAGVGLAMRDTTMVALERDAERMSALLESARARSRVSGVPVRWLADANGYRFEGLVGTELPQNWLDPDTSVAAAVVLALGPDPIIGRQEVTLVSRSTPGKSLRLATDGVRPFSLQQAPP